VPASALEPSHDPVSTARIVITDPSTAEARSATFDRYIRGATRWAPTLDSGVLSTTFGAPITMSGVTTLRYLEERPAGYCQQTIDDTGKGGIQVVLHGRNSSLWSVVGATKTDAQGKYSFTVKNPGAREYRAVLTDSAAGGVAQHPAPFNLTVL